MESFDFDENRQTADDTLSVHNAQPVASDEDFVDAPVVEEAQSVAVHRFDPMTGEPVMTAGVQEKYDRLIDGGLLPIKRWGQPEDIAEAVWTLCSGKLPYMTGQSLNIDGGFHIRRL